MDPQEKRSIIRLLASIALLVAITLLLIWLSGCAPAPAATQQTTPRPTATEVDCRLASAEQVQAVRSGLAPGSEVGELFAVPSPDHVNAWYLAAQIDSQDEPAVWIVSGVRSSPGLIGSVNSGARQVSDFPDASGTDFLTTPLDRGARAAIACVNQ